MQKVEAYNSANIIHAASVYSRKLVSNINAFMALFVEQCAMGVFTTGICKRSYAT